MRKRRLFKDGDVWRVQVGPVCYGFKTWAHAALLAWDNKWWYDIDMDSSSLVKS